MVADLPLSKPHRCNMKNRLLTFLFPDLGCRRICQNTIITGTLTVTNQISNGWTFSVNGHLRTITNLVSNPANQILTNTTEAGCATNLFNSFIAYPETSPYLIISMPASNVIQFQTLSSLSPALTFSTNWPTTLPPGDPGTACFLLGGLDLFNIQFDKRDRRAPPNQWHQPVRENEC